MTDRYTQIIPDAQAVACCLDPEMLEILGSHGTFILSELLEMIEGSTLDPTSFRELSDMIVTMTQRGHSRDHLFNEIVGLIETKELSVNKDILNEKVKESLLDGMTCNLLQPDGKGWQKGKLKYALNLYLKKLNLYQPKINQ